MSSGAQLVHRTCVCTGAASTSASPLQIYTENNSRIGFQLRRLC
jgi:hypothetical protein